MRLGLAEPCPHRLGLVVQNDTRSGEENKKEYGISDVKMIDIKKR
jgi:hypothetical protein